MVDVEDAKDVRQAIDYRLDRMEQTADELRELVGLNKPLHAVEVAQRIRRLGCIVSDLPERRERIVNLLCEYAGMACVKQAVEAAWNR